MEKSHNTYLTYAEAADFLNCKQSTLRKWVSRGEISYHRLGDKPRSPVRFTRQQLEEFVTTHARISVV